MSISDVQNGQNTTYDSKSIEQYLQRNNIFGMITDLTQALAINKPKKPLEYLVDIMSNKIRMLNT